jgi:hypothetical protein
LAVSLAIVGLLFSAWLINSAVLRTGASPGWLEVKSAPPISVVADTAAAFELGIEPRLFPRAVRRLIYAASIGLMAIAFLGSRPRRALVRLRGHHGLHVSLGYLVFPLVTSWLFSQIKVIYVLRYMLPFLFPYCLLLAAGIAEIRVVWLRSLVLGLNALLFVVGLWLNVQALYFHDWRVASAYIVDRAKPGDIVLFSPPWYEKPFQYYAKGQVAALEVSYPFVPDEMCDQVPIDIRRLWVVQPYPEHWTDPSNRLLTCLRGRFDLIDRFRFQPHSGTVYTFAAHMSE